MLLCWLGLLNVVLRYFHHAIARSGLHGLNGINNGLQLTLDSPIWTTLDEAGQRQHLPLCSIDFCFPASLFAVPTCCPVLRLLVIPTHLASFFTSLQPWEGLVTARCEGQTLLLTHHGRLLPQTPASWWVPRTHSKTVKTYRTTFQFSPC